MCTKFDPIHCAIARRALAGAVYLSHSIHLHSMLATVHMESHIDRVIDAATLPLEPVS